jgi:hypothetical protein
MYTNRNETVEKIKRGEGYKYPFLFSLSFSNSVSLSSPLSLSMLSVHSSPEKERPAAYGGAAVFSGQTSLKTKLLTPILRYFSS